MAYEIPQQLEYKEKIIFGLTFKQLAYLFIFAPLILIIFFKTGWNFTLRFLISAFLVCLAVGFIFLNLDYHVKSILAWLKYRKKILIEIFGSLENTIKANKERLRALVNVEKIENHLIYTIDKRKIAILRVEPINFGIKPQGAQEAIISSFQKFLNSLDFPIQIIMNTESLNLDDYFKAIEEKIQNSEFNSLFTKYIEHLDNVISKNDILNRKFYLVIPEKHDINIQIQLCMKKLENIGLKSIQLTNNELNKGRILPI